MDASLARYIPQIVASLRTVDPYRIFLFGSVSRGEEGPDSDLDITVILDSEYQHRSYDEKLETKLKVRKALGAVNYEIPIDLAVYSKAEFRKLQDLNPQWADEITDRGTLIYEKTH